LPMSAARRDHADERVKAGTRLIRRLPTRDRRCRALITAGGVQRCGAVPRGEPAAVGEAGDVTDVAEQPVGVGRADAAQLAQGAAGGVDELVQFNK